MRTPPAADVARAVAKPLLRGYSHALVTPVAAAAAVTLLVLSRGDRAKQATLLVYGVALVLLFGLSAVYHVGNWSPRAREVLRRLDHSNIFLLIAGTYTPIAWAGLHGLERWLVLGAVWGPSAIGISLVGLGLPMPRWLTALLYLLVGWVALLALPAILAAFKPGAIALAGAGGLCYSVGAICYASRRPRLWQRVFGYHEVFHLLVIAASICFFVFMLRFVLPAGA